MKNLVIFLLAMQIVGCANVQMYDGPRLERAEASLLFIHERPNMTYTSVDGEDVNFFPDGKVLEFRPGSHVFEVDLSTYQAYGTGYSTTSSTEFTVNRYRLNLEMRPGHTYALNFYGVNVDTLPHELCFEGEAHDAPGSSVNVTGEYRTMSDNAQVFGCAAAYETVEVGY